MNINNTMPSFYADNNQQSTDEIRTLDNISSDEMESSEINFGFLIMYEEWKQKILLSDGLNEDENYEW